jgi:hypothetical protein
MSIPWWVYLMGVVVIGFAGVLHMLPSYFARLEALDRKRREEVEQKKNEDDKIIG